MSVASASGSLPDGDAVPYLTDDPEHARALLSRPHTLNVRRRWYHVARRPDLPSIVWFGLMPGCWRNGDSCVVFGCDRMTEVPKWRVDDPVVEIESAAPPGQAKALWVAPSAILGVWDGANFTTAVDLREALPQPARPEVDGCPCPLAAVCREEQERWLTCGR